MAVRGGIVDVFPSTEDVAVRVDCFGDEVDRLTAFDVADQRSQADLVAVELFGCREVPLDAATRARAAVLAEEAGFARAQLARIAEGEVFEGVESLLKHLEGLFRKIEVSESDSIEGVNDQSRDFRNGFGFSAPCSQK